MTLHGLINALFLRSINSNRIQQQQIMYDFLCFCNSEQKRRKVCRWSSRSFSARFQFLVTAFNEHLKCTRKNLLRRLGDKFISSCQFAFSMNDLLLRREIFCIPLSEGHPATPWRTTEMNEITYFLSHYAL